jgi:hypothetical protein
MATVSGLAETGAAASKASKGKVRSIGFILARAS